MSQMQIRDKIRKVAEAVKQDDLIKERPKKIGLLVFFTFAIVCLICMLVVAILLAVNNFYKTAFVLAVITIGSFYMIYKLITADDLQSL